MQNIIFPAGLSMNHSNLSLEMMQFHSKRWNIEHHAIERDLFQAKLSATHTPRIQLGASGYSHGLISKGELPKGCVVLNSYYHTSGTYNLQNRRIEPHEIVVLRSGDELDRISTGGFKAHIVTIEEQLFDEAFYNYFGEVPNHFLRTKSLFIERGMVEVFHHIIKAWRHYLVNILPKLEIKPHYEDIESEILNQLFDCISFKILKRDRKKFPIKTVRALLHDNIYQNINIPTLSRALNISESQLHNAFKSHYGLTPKKYLLLLRLHAVRDELLRSKPYQVKVGELATKYCFWHLNHFAREYRKIFGEKPSETLRR